MQDWPNELVFVDRAGRATPVPGFDKPLTTGQARFSPAGRRIAFVEKAISGRLWLFDVERKTHRALSQDGLAGFPLWSPDGTRLVVRWSVAGPISLWSVPIEGGGAWERLTAADDVPSSFSPDGRTLAFSRMGARGRGDVLLYRFADHQVVPFIATDANEWAAAFSPDGRWLAYVSDESGRAEVYVTSFPDRRKTLVVSTRGGMEPAWSRDGTELFYRVYGAEGALMSVRVTLGEAIALGPPRRLFPSAAFDAYGGPFGYDLTPDGRGFLFGRDKPGVMPVPPAPITRLDLVHNWFAELERLCPTRR
jgi:serine/threonine-protein kinase